MKNTESAERSESMESSEHVESNRVNKELYMKSLVWSLLTMFSKGLGFAISIALIVQARGSLEENVITGFELLASVIALIAAYKVLHSTPSYSRMHLYDVSIGMFFTLVMMAAIMWGDILIIGTLFFVMTMTVVPIEVFFDIQKSRLRDRLLSGKHKEFLDDIRIAFLLLTTIASIIGSIGALIALSLGAPVIGVGFVGMLFILIGDLTGLVVWFKQVRHIKTHPDDLRGNLIEGNSIKLMAQRLLKV